MFATAAGAHIEKCDASHSPMLSQPDMLVGKIVEAIKKASG